METPLAFAERLSREAGSLLVEHFSRTRTTAAIKPDFSIVTEADLAADRLISEAIKNRYPDDAIVSEELHSEYATARKHVWVIDPLDGTSNFSLGLHLWGVSIARLAEGHPQIGVAYFPLLDELYSAEKNLGAFCDGERLVIPPDAAERPAAFFSCCTRTHRRYAVDVPFKTRIFGSAVYSFSMLVRGSAVLAFESTPKIWDLAASWLLITEAGGVIEPYRPENQPFPLATGHDYSRKNYPTLAAASHDLLNQARRQIVPAPS